jgi:OFA family oxalate/formate antiporter-like MFS transporter
MGMNGIPNERARKPIPASQQLGPRVGLENPWLQLAAGIVAMVAITNLQYGWTFFVAPLQSAFGWPEAAIQVAFTLFVLAETWLVPVEGYLVDRFGPRPLLFVGSVLVGLAWVVNSVAASLAVLYLGNILGGIGAGIVYGTSLGNALKWFPHRRGLAAGLTAAAFGAGSALTVLPLQGAIDKLGYQSAFLWFGLAQGAVVLGCALLIRAPRGFDVPVHGGARVRQSRKHYTWAEMIRSPAFWLMYAMFTMATMGGLMAIAQIAPMASDFQVADHRFVFLGSSMTALTLAVTLDRILNGLSRPFFGWVSDHLGRENTMFVAFSLEAVAIFLLIQFARDPVRFVVFTGLAFFAWGEIYSLFPALCGDLFGTRFATTNYGLLYTAKGTAALLVPLGNVLRDMTDSWAPIFYLAIAFDLSAAFLALLVLKPMCRSWLARTGPEEESG